MGSLLAKTTPVAQGSQSTPQQPTNENNEKSKDTSTHPTDVTEAASRPNNDVDVTKVTDTDTAPEPSSESKMDAASSSGDETELPISSDITVPADPEKCASDVTEAVSANPELPAVSDESVESIAIPVQEQPQVKTDNEDKQQPETIDTEDNQLSTTELAHKLEEMNVKTNESVQENDTSVNNVDAIVTSSECDTAPSDIDASREHTTPSGDVGHQLEVEDISEHNNDTQLENHGC